MTKNSMNSNSNSSSTAGVAAASNEEMRRQQQQQNCMIMNTNNNAGGGLRKGPWTAAEDSILVEHVRRYGEGNWNAVQRSSGLARCGKSCRLRWANHLRPNLKKGPFSPEEELLILRLHARIGNKWARIATHLNGRTDNEIKNYWNTRLKRRQRAGLPPYPLEVERELGITRQVAAFSDNRNITSFNGSVNSQFLPSPLNFSNAQTNGAIGANPLLNQNYQSYPNFANQMQSDQLPMLSFSNNGQNINANAFRPQMNYGLTSNYSGMMPNSYQPIKSEMQSSQTQTQTQMYHMEQNQVPRGTSTGTNATVAFNAQSVSGLGMQTMQRVPSLPNLPQLIPAEPSNWGNGNHANIGGNNGGIMNGQGEHSNKWVGPDCTNGTNNNSMLKAELKDSVIEKTMEELSILLNPDNSGGSGGETSGGAGGGSVITNDDHGMALHQHFLPPLTPEGPIVTWE